MKNKLTVVAIGVLMFIIGVVFALTFLDSIRSGGSNGVKAMENENSELILRDFRQLRGTNYFVAEVSTSYDARLIEYSSSARWFEFGEGGGQIRNLVFLDADTLSSQKLFETNQSLILRMVSFPEQPSQMNEDEEPEIVPIRWFAYEVVHQDTNQDEVLNQVDMRTIGISDVNGNRYKELLSDVTAIYEMSLIQQDELLIVYRQGNERFASKINLLKQTITTEILPDLGKGLD
jgi:hypothetical protein